MDFYGCSRICAGARQFSKGDSQRNARAGARSCGQRRARGVIIKLGAIRQLDLALGDTDYIDLGEKLRSAGWGMKIGYGSSWDEFERKAKKIIIKE